GLGQPPQDRFVGDRSLGNGCLPRLEQAREAEPPALPLGRDGRRRRTALLQPPVLEGDVLAERADVDEGLAVRREASRPLAQEQRALTNGAAASHGLPRDPHPRDYNDETEPGNGRAPLDCRSE